MSRINLILGDQLFDAPLPCADAGALMVEELTLASAFPYHSHKLVLTFAAMRHYAASLGDRVTYLSLDQEMTVFSALKLHRDKGYDEVHVFKPADRFFRKQLNDWCQELGIKLLLYRNPMFLTDDHEWQEFAKTNPNAIMADFYRWQRRRLGILVNEQGKPQGGAWSFDAENRKKLPRQHRSPPIIWPEQDPVTRTVASKVAELFPEASGNPFEFCWPVNRVSALEWLEDFLLERFFYFGAYEDAVSREQPYLYHSLISPLLNIGLLLPGEVVQKAVEHAKLHHIPINSQEGFVRQIIGWREYIRCIDSEDRWQSLDLKRGRTLKPLWYEGRTGLLPLDESIHRVNRSGWCHHIERLMFMGAVMYMCDICPQSALDFFMSRFIDATEWVMHPNVLGMSLHAAPTFATKPYFSGSAYVLKMTDYGPGAWCETWDGLYWHTVHSKRDQFSKNPRMQMAVRALDCLSSSKRDRLFNLATDFVERVSRPTE